MPSTPLLSVKAASCSVPLHATEFSGTAGLSELFQFDLELLVPAPGLDTFGQLLGQTALVTLQQVDKQQRYFHGLINKLDRSGRDTSFVRYRARLVPRLWLLTRTRQSRVFQAQSAIDILKEIFAPLRPDVEFRVSASDYPARDYCVQYRESDFTFASRLMEDEGLFYFFEHSAEGHRLVVADRPAAMAAPASLDGLDLRERSETADSVDIWSWRKCQELNAAQFTCWDQCFELGGSGTRAFQTLEAKKSIPDSVKVGGAEHALQFGSNRGLEIYDYPGGYAKNFDGIDRQGSERSDALDKISDDGTRRVALRAEEEVAHAWDIGGTGNCALLAAGLKFRLQGADSDDGQYYVKRIEHRARQAPPRGSGGPSASYENRFECLPADLPYRPRRFTPRPMIAGVQSATVVDVSSSAEKAERAPHVDKYGRVKVQFHWDRKGSFDGNSSCWIRVGQVWAGNRSGAFFWPRPGHEVLVAFEEGDPDCPVITGSVYNASNLPPVELPAEKNLSGIKSCSIGGDPLQEFNLLVYNDELEKEFLHLYSTNNASLTSEFANVVDRYGPEVQVHGWPILPVSGSGSGAGHKGWGGSHQAGQTSHRLAKLLSFPLGAYYYNFLTTNDNYIGGNYNLELVGGGTQCFALGVPTDLPGVSGAFATFLSCLQKFDPLPDMNISYTLGDQASFSYAGKSVSITRGPSVSLERDHLFSGSEDKATLALILLHYATVAASNMGAAFTARYGISGGGWELAFASSKLVTRLIAYVLRCWEVKLAEAEPAAATAEQALEEVKTATQACAELFNLGNSLNRASNKLDLAQERAENAINLLQRIVGISPADSASDPQVVSFDKPYHIVAHDVSIRAEDRAETKTNHGNITLTAVRDSTQSAGGNIDTQADGYVAIESSESVLYLGGEGEGLDLVTWGSGDLVIGHGAQLTSLCAITLSSSGIKLETGNELLPVTIDMTSSAINLTCGIYPKASQISMSSDGITLKAGATTSLEVTAEGVKISGITIETAALSQLKATAVLKQESVSGLADEQAGLQQQN